MKFNSLDDDDNPLASFRSTFRMDKETFEWLVVRLSNHPELRFTAHNAKTTKMDGISRDTWISSTSLRAEKNTAFQKGCTQ